MKKLDINRFLGKENYSCKNPLVFTKVYEYNKNIFIGNGQTYLELFDYKVMNKEDLPIPMARVLDKFKNESKKTDKTLVEKLLSLDTSFYTKNHCLQFYRDNDTFFSMTRENIDNLQYIYNYFSCPDYVVKIYRGEVTNMFIFETEYFRFYTTFNVEDHEKTFISYLENEGSKSYSWIDLINKCNSGQYAIGTKKIFEDLKKENIRYENMYHIVLTPVEFSLFKKIYAKYMTEC